MSQFQITPSKHRKHMWLVAIIYCTAWASSTSYTHLSHTKLEACWFLSTQSLFCGTDFCWMRTWGPPFAVDMFEWLTAPAFKSHSSREACPDYAPPPPALCSLLCPGTLTSIITAPASWPRSASAPHSPLLYAPEHRALSVSFIAQALLPTQQRLSKYLPDAQMDG